MRLMFPSSGFPDAIARKADELRPVLDVSVDGRRYTLTSNSGMQNSSSSFALNEKYEEKMPNGNRLQVGGTLDLRRAVLIIIRLQSTAVLEQENKIVVTSLREDGAKGERIYEFTKGGLVLVSSKVARDAPARSVYFSAGLRDKI